MIVRIHAKFPILPRWSILPTNHHSRREATSMCVREYLTGQRVWFETLLHRPAPSASGWPGASTCRGGSGQGGPGPRGRGVCPGGLAGDAPDRPGAAVRWSWGRGRSAWRREDEVMRTFGDCERGALPPFGRLYGLTTRGRRQPGGRRARSSSWGTPGMKGCGCATATSRPWRRPIRARFATAIEPRRRRPSHRRAG